MGASAPLVRIIRGAAARAERSRPHKGLTVSEVLDVDVRSEPGVVGEIPTNVIGIFINHDLVRVPKPAIAKRDIIRSDAKVEATKPEAIRTASSQPPHMTAAKAASEVSMFPGMVEMVVNIIRASLMPDPLTVGMNVGSVRVPVLIGKGTVLGGCRGIASHRSRTVRWNMTAANSFNATSVTAFFLRDRQERA